MQARLDNLLHLVRYFESYSSGPHKGRWPGGIIVEVIDVIEDRAFVCDPETGTQGWVFTDQMKIVGREPKTPTVWERIQMSDKLDPADVLIGWKVASDGEKWEATLGDYTFARPTWIEMLTECNRVNLEVMSLKDWP